MITSKDSVTKYDSFDRYISALNGWYEVNGLQIALAKKNENEEESNRSNIVRMTTLARAKRAARKGL
jgi:hypothetical protein